MDIQFVLDVEASLVLCIFALAPQRHKKASVRFSELLVMKPQNKMIVLSNYSDV